MPEFEDRAVKAGDSERAPMVSTEGVSLGRIRGIGVRLDWSLLIIFALITFQLGVGVFPSWHPGWSAPLVWAMALATAVLFFASVLVHELSHALVAQRQGIEVRRITLFLFGGVTQLEGEPSTPKSEFWIAIVGPIVSVVIGLAATAGGLALVGEPLRSAIETGDALAVRDAFSHAGPLATLLLWLGPINLLLGLFNIIPGFPLDGGRVLRSILWAITKNLRTATRWAAFVGQVFAWTLMAWGVLNLFAGVWLSGVWLILIGWFLNNAARASYQHLLVKQALEDVPISRVMRSSFSSVVPELSVDVFVRDYALASEQQVFPVEAGELLLGVVGIEQVRAVPQSEWPRTTVQQIMIPEAALPTLPPDAGAERALHELTRTDVDQLLVLDGHKLLGLVRRADLLRWFDFQQWAAAKG
jgi:Zn-dependent protease